MTKPTELYRHFNADGELLYVGISLLTLERTVKHQDGSHWWPEVTRIDIERFKTRSSAMDAERTAIINEKPKHNVQGALGFDADPFARTVIKFFWYGDVFTTRFIRSLAADLTGFEPSRVQIEALLGRRDSQPSPYEACAEVVGDFRPRDFLAGNCSDQTYELASKILGEPVSRNQLDHRYGPRDGSMPKGRKR